MINLIANGFHCVCKVTRHCDYRFKFREACLISVSCALVHKQDFRVDLSEEFICSPDQVEHRLIWLIDLLKMFDETRVCVKFTVAKLWIRLCWLDKIIIHFLTAVLVITKVF